MSTSSTLLVTALTERTYHTCCTVLCGATMKWLASRSLDCCGLAGMQDDDRGASLKHHDALLLLALPLSQFLLFLF